MDRLLLAAISAGLVAQRVLQVVGEGGVLLLAANRALQEGLQVEPAQLVDFAVELLQLLVLEEDGLYLVGEVVAADVEGDEELLVLAV